MRYSALVLLLFSILILPYSGISQTVNAKLVDINIVPGLGTSGLDHNLSRNYFTINLFSGYTDQTLLFQISNISGTNRTYSGGLHIAGIGNFTGVNLKSMDPEEYETSVVPFIHLEGFQVGGIINLVRGDVTGGQASCLFNIIHKEMVGAQFGGLFNYVGRYATGVQIGGIGNHVSGSIDGFQLSAGYNKAGGELFGNQIGLINYAQTIEGKNSKIEDNRTGLQIGVLNLARKMNGFQVGLVNISKQSQGTQIGLINFYPRGGKLIDTRDGTAIGLLNLGDLEYISFYTNEIFGLNYELSTGNRKNERIKLDKQNVYVTNAIIYSHKSFGDNNWGIGYGLRKMFFNRTGLPGMVESRFKSYGLDVQHINLTKGEFTKNLSLLTRFKFMVGKRVTPKLFGVNWCVSISMNFYWSDFENSIAPKFLSSTTSVKKINLEYWPGCSLGILLH